MKLVESNKAKIATYVEGHGPSIIFLHGGPGDTHHYMKRMARPLFKDFQCIFFDQRGTGESIVDLREESSFELHLMLQDIEAIQKFYNTGPCAIVGHSWGAMYGLFACIKNPELFPKAALINMGPLDNELGLQAYKNITSVFSEDEKAQWVNLRKKRNQAQSDNDTKQVAVIDEAIMQLRVKAWVFNPDLRNEFLKDYFQDPPPDRAVNGWVWGNLENQFSWDQVPEATSKIWICAGENDAIPIEQAVRVNSLLPNSDLSIYEKCGHIPWLEHSEKFYCDLNRFLKNG